MSLVEVGVLLARSVHTLDDDAARIMRDAALAHGASPQLVAEALRLRDERMESDVTVLECWA